MSRFKGWKTKPEGNRKVKNATKVQSDGQVFDSKLEAYMYEQLRSNNIGFELKKKFVLQEGFQYNGEAIRAITIIPDFWFPDRCLVVDTKGFQTDVSAVRFKLLKKHLSERYENSEVVLLKNKKEIDGFILKLKFNLV